MIRYLLDTNQVSDLRRGKSLLMAKVALVRPESLAISVETVFELVRGRMAELGRHHEGPERVHAYGKLMETIRFCNSVPVVPFDTACEERFVALRKLHRRTGAPDLRIAATALVHNLVLVTANQRDFDGINSLHLENWSVDESAASPSEAPPDRASGAGEELGVTTSGLT